MAQKGTRLFKKYKELSSLRWKCKELYGLEISYDITTDTVYAKSKIGFWKIYTSSSTNLLVLYHKNFYNKKLSDETQKQGQFHRQKDVKQTSDLAFLYHYIGKHDKAKEKGMLIKINYDRRVIAENDIEIIMEKEEKKVTKNGCSKAANHRRNIKGKRGSKVKALTRQHEIDRKKNKHFNSIIKSTDFTSEGFTAGKKLKYYDMIMDFK